MRDNYLIEDAKKAVKYSLQYGAEHAEAYISEIEILTLNVENGILKFYGKNYNHGLGMRIAKDKKVGFSYTESINEKNIANCAKNAIKLSELKKPDSNFEGFPDPQTPTRVEDIYDKQIVDIGPETAEDYTLRMVEAAKAKYNEIIPTFGFFESSIKIFSIANSNGIEVTDSGTTVKAGLSTLINSMGENSSGLDFQSSRNLKEMNPELIGENSTELALGSMKLKRIQSFNTTVILDSFAVAWLFSEVLIPSMYASKIEEKSSCLVNKISQKIASENVTIIDDGTLRGGYNTSTVDQEGLSTKRKILIDEGYLKGYLYDHYSAKKEGRESTGNAFRFEQLHDRDARGREYTMVPKIGSSNFILEKGRIKRDEMIEEVEDGVLITFTIGGGSATTGDFSFDTRNVFRIENGEITYPIRQAIYSGNLFDFLLNINAISDNSKSSEGNKPGDILVPSIKVENGLIIGDK